MNFLIKYRSGNSISLNHFYLSTFQKAVLLVLLFVPFWASAQTDLSVDKNGMVAIPEPPNPPKLLNDFADVLTPEQEQTLESRLVTIDNGSSVQIAVVTVKTTGIIPLTDYGQSLFQKWGIGQKGKNNGLLLIVAIDDRKSEINVGYNLEDVVGDADARVLLREVLKPYFKEGLYYEGLTATADSLFQLSQGKYQFDAEKAQKGNKKDKSSSKGVAFWIAMAIIAFIILSRFGNKGGGRGGNRGGGLSDILIPAMLFGAGRSSSNWGNFSGGSGSFGGGGSFGGFGGGSSGGGGASGDW
jgi:uncharacterized protein